MLLTWGHDHYNSKYPISLTCNTKIVIAQNPAFYLLIWNCFFLSLPVCYFLMSYILTISSYLHHHISCRLRRFHLVCRWSSVPLGTTGLLVPCSGGVLPSQHVSISCLVVSSLSIHCLLGLIICIYFKAPLVELGLLSVVIYSDI